jgi:mRNA-degrading endonuclease toxin of MazEF toxin-antitoxin module
MVVVSHDAFNTNERYPKVLAVHVTSVRRPGGPFDWEIDVPRGVAGLQRASVIKCAEIYTLLKADLVTRAGTLPAKLIARVDRALALALALPTPLADDD